MSIGVELDVFTGEEAACLRLSGAEMYTEFVEKVVRKNPDLDICLQLCEDYGFDCFPNAPVLLSLQRVRVLSLCECDNVEHVDLSCIPEFRSLTIMSCAGLEAISGWEVVRELGWLEIGHCGMYGEFPRVEWLPSLREFCFTWNTRKARGMFGLPDFSQCVGLWRLKMTGEYFLHMSSLDLSTLRYLEVLKLDDFGALIGIQGLGGLRYLTRLELTRCSAMRGVAELGCLKALTHLYLSGSGVEEITGVQELRLLTHLCLERCVSLKGLPWMGHLRALVMLDIRFSGMEKVPGIEHLVSLESLDYVFSRAKVLPELQHLPRLKRVDVAYTPVQCDPSSAYYGKDFVVFERKEGRIDFVDDVDI